jgi:2-methylisocitrate lyase-like PEP mutase family enzyme
MTTPASEVARAFHGLHRDGLLVLANAWDAGSARLFQSLGAKAIATTSAGVAWTHGYPDGDTLPLHLMLSSVSAIARVIDVPLSVDMESGFAREPAGVGEAVAEVIDAGGVGINIEDGDGPPDLLCAKIERAKDAGQRRGVEVFVNARADVYLRGLVPAAARETETIARGERYRQAGADGFFAPGVIAAGEIRAIADAVALPLNVLAQPGLPRAAELFLLGVRRLSSGSGLNQAAYGRARALAAAFLQDGASDPLREGCMPYAEINALMQVD